jgi:hypothetical protein
VRVEQEQVLVRKGLLPAGVQQHDNLSERMGG